MTDIIEKPIHTRIAALLKEAAPLRELDHDDPRAEPLAGLVDEINKLRARQEKEAHESWRQGYVAANPAVAPDPDGDEDSDAQNATPEGGDALPSREELEEAAAQVGVTFSPRIGDRKLFERIAAARTEARKDDR